MAYNTYTLEVLHKLTEAGEAEYQRLLAERAEYIKKHPVKAFVANTLAKLLRR